MEEKRAWIFVNGELSRPDLLKSRLAPGDLRIAADGGLKHLQAMNLLPDLLIGDLDSTDPEVVAQLAEQGVQVERHPVEKDETDLELAVLRAVQLGCGCLRLAGALGGRLDMTLGNLFLLGLPAVEGLDVRMDDGLEEVFLIRSQGDIEGQAGERVSLLPLGSPASGVRTEGLYYPLRGETLYPERTRGISNVMLGSSARVTLEKGILICIHSRFDPKREQREN